MMRIHGLFAVNHLLGLSVILSFLPIHVEQVVSQDHFVDPIPKGLRVGVENFARIPNSSGSPARMSVMTHDPLGRLFVNDQRGQLFTVSGNGNDVVPYLDINSFAGVNLTAGGERGFQSFAFHPDFSDSGSSGFGKFYTIHSSSNTTPAPDFSIGTSTSFHTVLLEWTTNDPTANTYSAGGNSAPREVLRFNQPFGNHNAGQIAFNTSADSTNSDRTNLYIALGDGGSGGDPLEAGQDTSNPYGAILRIDPLGNNSNNQQYGIVSDNVFAGDGDSNTLAEVFAFGLRNPQRMGWDSATGNFFAADIGQNAVEELDLVVNGGNFGWDQREGSFEFEGPKTADMIDPVAEYDHTNFVDQLPTSIGNRAITMGDVIRGSDVPELNGMLLAGDFPTGILLHLDVDNDPLDGGQDGLFQLVLVNEIGEEVFLLDLINQERTNQGLNPVSRADLRFSYGLDGDVYILNKHDGVIRRLTVAVPEPSWIPILMSVLTAALLIRRPNSARAVANATGF